MITQAIQTALVAITPNTYGKMGDEVIKAPYCVHREQCVGYTELKDNSKEFVWEVEVALIEDSSGNLETLSESARAAVIALEGTTTNSTRIQDVTFMGDAPDYDDEEKLFVTIQRYSITTTNR